LQPPKQKPVYYFHTDPNGCPGRISNAHGRTVWAGSHRLWGEPNDTRVEELKNRIVFLNQYRDEESGLLYNRFRYFDSGSGQYVTRDPLGLVAGPNLYGYPPNPLMHADPLGLIDLGYKGPDGSGYTIYSLVDRKTGVVKYVGLTENARFWDRMNEHAKSGRLHGDLESIELDAAETYAEARGKEQFYIEKHRTMQTSARGKAFGPHTEGNRQAGFDTARTDTRGKTFKEHYDAMTPESPGCRI
jgi:RHS repeat-associated protein